MANAKPARPKTKAPKAGGGLRSAVTGQMFIQKGPANSKVSTVAIAVTPGVFKTLAARQSTIESLMETFGQTIERSRKSGRAGGFTVMIDSAGNPEIAPLQRAQSAEPAIAKDDRLDAALKAARERGRLRAAEILDQDDMLTAEEFAARLGVSRVTVNARRQKHELLGLDGAKRGFRFPTWQVDEDGKPLDALPKLFELLGDSPWGVYRFLTQRHSVLDGASAKDALARGRATQVLEAAESLAQGDFA